MKHPNQATLALHAGGDLGLLRAVESRTPSRRHATVAATRSMRSPPCARFPNWQRSPKSTWNRLAAEMRANIRLGLEAGECVRAGEPPLRERRFFTGARAVVALASMVALLVTGIVLEHPAPTVVADEGMVVQATTNGIQVSQGGQALRLMNPTLAPQRVMYSPDAQGSMRARYVDPETGNVTINNVYAE